jgi:hypothetical protein
MAIIIAIGVIDLHQYVQTFHNFSKDGVLSVKVFQVVPGCNEKLK